MRVSVIYIIACGLTVHNILALGFEYLGNTNVSFYADLFRHLDAGSGELTEQLKKYTRL